MTVDVSGTSIKLALLTTITGDGLPPRYLRITTR